MRFSNTTIIISVFSTLIVTTHSANALQINYKKFNLDFDASGTAGMFKTKSDDFSLLTDWETRIKAAYNISKKQSVGLVYAIDDIATSHGECFHEVFLYSQDNSLGRAEIGLNHSIASKLGIGLPDVSGLRFNEYPLFYKNIKPKSAIISNTTLFSGHESLRLNLATISRNGIQYGVSASGLGDEYNYDIDFAIKIKNSVGKIKTALSFATSFIDSPSNFEADIYNPEVTADWRAQTAMGFNLQYNSFIWGLSGKIIYDKQPLIPASDGFIAGSGISYDLLKYTLSLSYLFSETGLWHNETHNYQDHSTIASFRYKYTENIHLWLSGGISTQTPFVSAGIKMQI